MKGYIAFTKKEILENIYNFRFIILCAIFIMFGITGVLFAKFTHQILEILANNIRTDTIPEAIDSWKQFYKNIPSVGYSALLILYGSSLSNEYSKGTLVLMITKGLSRTTIILSKFTVAVITMTISYWITFAVTYGYTNYFWDNSQMDNVVISGVLLWIIGLLYLSILMLGCVLFKQTFTSILFTGGIVVVLSLSNIINPLKQFSPMMLTSKNIELISGEAERNIFIIPIILTFSLVIFFLTSATLLFKKKQL